MSGWMTWSSSIRISFRGAVAVIWLGAAVCLGVSRASAQQSADELYQKASDAYDAGHMEEACDGFNKLAAVSPGFKDIEKMRKVSCETVISMHTAEENYFKKGVDLYKQGDFEGSKSLFEKAMGIPLKVHVHRAEISQYLQQIESQQGSEKAFQTGVSLFNQGQYQSARGYFTQVAQGSGPHAAEARDYLNRISTELAKQVKKPPEEIITHVKTIPPPKVTSTPESKPLADTEEPALRAGLQAYFAGDFKGAEKSFSDYLEKNGRRKSLAYFFRGASFGTEYYLSGEKDSKQRDNAVADFRSVKDSDSHFLLPDKQYVAPKILALYSDAVGAGN